MCRTQITFLVTVKTLDHFVDKMYGSFVSEDGRAARNSLREERLNLRREEERHQREREEKLERIRRWLLRRLSEEVDIERWMIMNDFLYELNYRPTEFPMDDFMAFAGVGAYI